MSNFSTKGMKTEGDKRVSKYMQYGIQNFRINSIELRKSTPKADGSYSMQIQFNVETPKVVTTGFEADPAALNGGQVGRVLFPKYYMSGKEVQDYIGGTKIMCTDFDACVRRIGIIADKLGVREQVDAIDADTFEDYIEQVTPLITGKFAWWKVAAEEYLKNDGSGKKGTRLSLAHYGFIASNEEGASSLKFDKGNTYDFKIADTPDTATAGQTVDDMPF